MIAVSFYSADDVKADQEFILSSLPFGSAEANRLSKIHNFETKSESLAALIALRSITDRIGTSTDITIQRQKSGKPVFKGSSLHFSLSHSNGLAVAVLSDVPVGIDIELIRDNKNFLNIAKRFFTADEYLKISKSDYPNEIFYLFWTQKEAFSKISGDGMLSECAKETSPDNSVLIKKYRVFFKNSIFSLSICAKDSLDTNINIYPYEELKLYEIQD